MIGKRKEEKKFRRRLKRRMKRLKCKIRGLKRTSSSKCVKTSIGKPFFERVKAKEFIKDFIKYRNRYFQSRERVGLGRTFERKDGMGLGFSETHTGKIFSF